MTKTIKVGDLRRNSSDMLTGVQNGDEYVVTNHGREVARIVPVGEERRWVHNRGQVLDVLGSMSSPDLAALVEDARRAEQGADL